MPNLLPRQGVNPVGPRRKHSWPTRGSLMTYRSVASRKRAAAARLQARASVLLAEAADLDARAERLLTADERP
jgi:hypothetical protein